MKRYLLQILISILLCTSLFFEEAKIVVMAQEQEETLSLYAKSAVLMDAESKRILYGKNEGNFMPNASTTKIMTCILAIESGKLDETVTVSEYAASMPKVHLGMSKGEQFILKDLLHSLMLESHNDSAVAIAEHIGGSVEGFADMMNAKAKELGCEHTHFITPNGLDAEDEISVHGTTTTDLAAIMSYCIQNETFLEITQTGQYQFSNCEGTKKYSCTNRNALLQMVEGVISGKTGFTADAGYCYVGAVKRGERTFVVALLACGWPNNKNYKWEDSKTLINYGFENFEKVIVRTDKTLEPLPVIEAANEGYDPQKEILMPISIAGKDIKILKAKDEKVQVKYSGKKTLTAPIKKGDVVGNVEYYVGKEKVAAYPIVTLESAKLRTREWYMKCIWEKLHL